MSVFRLLVTGHTDPTPGAMDDVASARCIIEQNLRGGPCAAYIDSVEPAPDGDGLISILMWIAGHPDNAELVQSFADVYPESARKVRDAFIAADLGPSSAHI